MHDLSIIDAILNSIQPSKTVRKITLARGEFSEHTEHALQETFEILTADSMFFNSTELVITPKHGKIICTKCEYSGPEYAEIRRSEMHGVPPIIKCPKCGSFETTIIEDGGVDLVSVEY